MNKPNIRPAIENDIKLVQEIADVPELRVTGEKRPPSERWLKAFIDEKQIFLIAEINKELVGFILGERTTGDLAYLWEVGISKNFRRKGIGKVLLNSFVKECKKRKLRSIITYSHLNERTLNFFKNNEFFEGEDCRELKRRIIK